MDRKSHTIKKRWLRTLLRPSVYKMKMLVSMVCVVCLSLPIYTIAKLRHGGHYRYIPSSNATTNAQQPFTSFNYTNIEQRQFLVSWYDVPLFIKVRRAALNRTFDSCRFSNCIMSINRKPRKNRKDVPNSHVVLFKGRRLPELNPDFRKPLNQVWIFAEDETPVTYDRFGGKWQLPGYKNVFNWTMTYDKQNTDIFLPYGEVVKHKHTVDRDFLSIAKAKTKDAVIITSHCKTLSERMEYVHELQKYIDVDVIGTCGRPWNCGKQWIHNDCFSILNTTYRYYLAFENAFCRGYRTEKYYENFQYDLLMVTRGDASAFTDEPTDAYISTSNFKTVEDLGKYLKSLSESPEKYADALRKKSQYRSLPYEEVYQRSLCEICKRLNFQEDYRNVIEDLDTWRDVNVCYSPTDLNPAA